jgi:hypothetical protein
MPRLSLWKKDKTFDYQFMDSTIREQFYVGGVSIYVHKYMGPKTVEGKDIARPAITEQSATKIQDFLLLENRDYKYDPDVYELRGHYQPSNLDFDLSQFGLFLQNDTVFITFHYNDMIDRIGRKLMPGDVLELPNLVDDYPLDLAIPISLKKFYVIQDAARASEGYSPTWWPHIWRIKCVPLMDAQQYQDIFGSGTSTEDLKNYLSSYLKLKNINEQVVAQAEDDAPESGYDTTMYYVAGTNEVDGKAQLTNSNGDPISPNSNGWLDGYLTGDGIAPNGIVSGFGTSFPGGAAEGDFFLRTDYMPNRLFRFNGSRWIKFEDDVRMTMTNDDTRATLKAGFVNNTAETKKKSGGTISQRQSLSDLLKLKEDN